MPNKWLFKEEPTHYNFSEFRKDGKTVWEGVKNPFAQKYLRQVKKGDRVFYYHTGKEKAVVGTARATSNAYLDPKKKDGKTVVVDLAPVKALPEPVTLASIKALARKITRFRPTSVGLVGVTVYREFKGARVRKHEDIRTLDTLVL